MMTSDARNRAPLLRRGGPDFTELAASFLRSARSASSSARVLACAFFQRRSLR